MSTPQLHVESATPFRYAPLDKAKSEIRLLWIPQSTPHSNSSLQLSLIHTSLENIRDFVALSYCWGGQHADRPITIHGSLIYITESLETALLNLRSRDAGFFLWADAICINQKDNAEKTSQVQIMRDIYRAAVQVLIWLGPSTVEMDNAIRGIRELGDQLLGIGILDLVAEKRRQLVPWMMQPDDGSRAAAIRNHLLSAMVLYREAAREGRDPFWWLSFELAERQWFHRMWCVQECVNARIATLRCGNAEIDYRQVQAVSWFYKLYMPFILGSLPGHAKAPDLTKQLNVTKFQHFEGPMPTTILDLRQKSLHNPVFSLRDLLVLTNRVPNNLVPSGGAARSIGATDDRDRVYALLGVATDEAPQHITPDYTLSCHDAYVITARVLLDHGHYDIFSLCQVEDRKHNLPSWTPDWSTPMEETWSMPTFSPDRDYNACGHLTKQARKANTHANASRDLDLDSVIVDTIDEAGAPYATKILDFRNGKQWYDLRQYFCDLNNYLEQSERYSAEQKKEAEWRIPIADMEYNASTRKMTRPSSLSRMEAGYMLAKKMYGWSRDDPPPQLGSAWLEMAGPELLDGDSPYSCFMYQVEGMSRTRPFLSKNGYVGLCPQDTASGDKIVIFAGAKVPYVVRSNPDNNTSTLVGEAYVHGIMDGESVSENAQTETITLQ
ncbi:hypothetical protein M3J09_012882 [Ascochyta lentis]